MRGRDPDVQRRAATHLRRRFYSIEPSAAPLAAPSSPTGGAGSGWGTAPESGLGPEWKLASLCSATGPPVRHDSVGLYCNDDGVLPPRKISDETVQAAMGPSGYLAKSAPARIARSLVSGSKRRFQEDGFDLDLTYITARIIAMGFPSCGLESSYRNSMVDVYRFFQERHAGHYRIVNLCSERGYSLESFHANCVRYPFPDHNPPALELILPCCASIHKFLQADPDNVVAIHCKAGKGRTGLMVVCYLMYCGCKNSALEARAMYDAARTSDSKGLTIISQIRYAHYFELLLRRLKSGLGPPFTAQHESPAVTLHRLRLRPPPHFSGGAGRRPVVVVEVRSEIDHRDYEVFSSDRGATGGGAVFGRSFSSGGMLHRGSFGGGASGVAARDTVELGLDGGDGSGTRVAGDFKVVVMDEHRSKKLLFFWLHTSFLTAPPPDMCGTARRLSAAEREAAGLPEGSGPAWRLTLYKREMDMVAKDTRCAHFDPDFRVDLLFTPLPGQTGSGPALELARAAVAFADPQRARAASISPTASAVACAAPAAREGGGGGGGASSRTGSAVGWSGGGGGEDGPLGHDRAAYRRYADGLTAAGAQPLTFEAWLLDHSCAAPPPPAAARGGRLSSLAAHGRIPSLSAASAMGSMRWDDRSEGSRLSTPLVAVAGPRRSLNTATAFYSAATAAATSVAAGGGVGDVGGGGDGGLGASTAADEGASPPAETAAAPAVLSTAAAAAGAAAEAVEMGGDLLPRVFEGGEMLLSTTPPPTPPQEWAGIGGVTFGGDGRRSESLGPPTPPRGLRITVRLPLGAPPDDGADGRSGRGEGGSGGDDCLGWGAGGGSSLRYL